MAKKQQFIQKVQEMLVEYEKKRIHIAQGLPWTTDEPEVCYFVMLYCLIFLNTARPAAVAFCPIPWKEDKFVVKLD
jgi:hypothetical protein